MDSLTFDLDQMREEENSLVVVTLTDGDELLAITSDASAEVRENFVFTRGI